MTLEQLRMFVAVAEREHLTEAADALHRTPSAISAAIRTLEERYQIALFNRVGRRIELTEVGRLFLAEARAVLARADSARNLLADLAGLDLGSISVAASQTIASYWLPGHLMTFHANHPGIDVRLSIGNTQSVADAVLGGAAEIGFVEGEVMDDSLNVTPLATDELVVVVGSDHPWATGRMLTSGDLASGSNWIMREPGSGTRAEVLHAFETHGLALSDLKIAMELPSNEAVLTAVLSGKCAAALSRAAAQPLIDAGRLQVAGFQLPTRAFSMLVHTERHPGRAAMALAEMIAENSRN